MNQSPSSQRSGLDDVFVSAIRRVRGEFIEMPGLQLTPEQAALLWSFDADLCVAVLDALVATRFLTRTKGATFARVP